MVGARVGLGTGEGGESSRATSPSAAGEQRSDGGAATGTSSSRPTVGDEPSSPADGLDFSPHSLLRFLAGIERLEPRLLLLVLPLVHAMGHHCKDAFNSPSVKGAGWVSEVAEQFFAHGGQTTRAGQAYNMSATSHAFFHTFLTSLHNQQMVLDTARALVHRFVALHHKLLERREEKASLLAAVRRAFGGEDIDDAFLEARHEQRADAAMPVAGTPAPVETQDLLKAMAMKARLSALELCLATSLAAGGSSDAERERVFVAMLAASKDAQAALARRQHKNEDSGLKFKMAQRVVLQLKRQLDRADGGVPVPLDTLAVQEMKILHATASKLRGAREELAVTPKADLRRENLGKIVAHLLAKARDSLERLKLWLPKVADEEVRAWAHAIDGLPAGEVDEEGRLPQTYRGTPLAPGGTDVDRLVTVHLDVKALELQLSRCAEDAASAVKNVGVVLRMLEIQLRFACTAETADDLESASGRSGLFMAVQPPPNLPPLAFSTVLSDVKCDYTRMAAGLAFDIQRGICTFTKLSEQLRRVADGIAALQLLEGGTPGPLARTSDKKTVALVYAHELMAGKIPAEEWARRAVEGYQPAHGRASTPMSDGANGGGSTGSDGKAAAYDATDGESEQEEEEEEDYEGGEEGDLQGQWAMEGDVGGFDTYSTDDDDEEEENVEEEEGDVEMR